MPQYTYALSGTKGFSSNLISRASSTKIRGEDKGYLGSDQCLKAKVEDIIVSSRSRITANPELVVII